MDLICVSIHSSSRLEVDVVKRGGWGGGVILASCKYHFIKVHENLVQHPCYNIQFFPLTDVRARHSVIIKNRFIGEKYQNLSSRKLSHVFLYF